MNKEFAARRFAVVGAMIVVAGIAAQTERGYIVLLGLAFMLCGLGLYALNKRGGEK